MQCEDAYENTIREADQQGATSSVRLNTLPEKQNAYRKCSQNEIPEIIERIVNIAREIGWLSERRMPVESDIINPPVHFTPGCKG